MSSCEVADDVMVETGELLQPLVEAGTLAVVPPRFIRPPDQRPSATLAAECSLSLPIVSLRMISGEIRSHTMSQLREACEQWGFFQVVDHSIPQSVIDAVQEASWAFIKSPQEDKDLCAKGKEGRISGYGRLFKGSETTVWDWVDVLTHRVGPYPLSSQDSAAWPVKPASYRPAMEKYAEEVQKLRQRLMRLLSEILHISNSLTEGPNEFKSEVVRVNYYPTCPQPELVMGLSSHSDPGGLTILLRASEASGLQVRKDGVWVPVHPKPGALIVNLGDQFQVLTNGKFKSVEHRVIMNQGRDRLSIAHFSSPLLGTTISPLPELVDNDRGSGRLYPTYKFGDYVRLFMNHQLGARRFLDLVIEDGGLPTEDYHVNAEGGQKSGV